ncbi:MAG: acyl-CoA dehydrogenase family protein [Nitratireductor sp.]|uniref:acyl-CoA dehydrogenase family protein n=2 Tax=Rhodobacterales TaxID=204455 RepID=UPI00327509A8
MTVDTANQPEFLEGLRRCVRERLAPLEAVVAEQDMVREDIIAEMREMGHFGLTVPEDDGGPGRTVSKEIELVCELTWASLAFRSATVDVYSEEAFVPAKNIIGGQPGRGFATAMKALDGGRIAVAAACIGQARRNLNMAVNYAETREQFGHRISQFQLMHAMLAQ